MKHALLLAVHEEPEHVLRLCRALADPRVQIFMHVDVKSDLDQFKQSIELSHVRLIEERVDVKWGGWSQVRATLKMLKAARSSSESFSYFGLLSGTHFPLRLPSTLYDLLDKSDCDFINTVSIPCERAGKPLERFTRWHLEGGDRYSGGRAHALRIVNRILAKFPLPIPASLRGHLWAGSSWWFLRRESIQAVEYWLHSRTRDVGFFRHRFCPDESFFQTVVMNSDRPAPRRDLTFTDWSSGGSTPAKIGMQHIESLLAPEFAMSGVYGAGPAYLARKFCGENANVVDTIAHQIGLERRQSD